MVDQALRDLAAARVAQDNLEAAAALKKEILLLAAEKLAAMTAPLAGAEAAASTALGHRQATAAIAESVAQVLAEVLERQTAIETTISGNVPAHEIDQEGHRFRLITPNDGWGDWLDLPPGPRGPQGGVPAERQISAGVGLSGGGDLAADREIALSQATINLLDELSAAVGALSSSLAGKLGAGASVAVLAESDEAKIMTAGERELLALLSLIATSGDRTLVLNKDAAGDTASVLLRTGGSGRAEIGTIGDSKLRVRVSPDGSNWTIPFVIDPATGFVGIGTDTPEGPLHILRAASSPVHERIDNTNAAPTTQSRKARGTVGAKAALVAGDVVQGFFGQGFDGAAYIGCANLRWVTEGAVSTGIVQTRLEFWTFGVAHAERMRITPSGDIGVGVTAPTARIHTDGAVRVGQYAKASLPSASTLGAGAIIHVTDEAGGAVLAFSDGTNWRRVTDRVVVS